MIKTLNIYRYYYNNKKKYYFECFLIFGKIIQYKNISKVGIGAYLLLIINV